MVKLPTCSKWFLKMLAELNIAKKYLVSKFGNVENVEPGTYAVPVETKKGLAFMSVTISQDLGMSGFDLFKDEGLTQSWYE